MRNGVLPADYIPTVDLEKMEDAPWMLGLNGAGNVRATNLLGNNSIAAYVNSSVTFNVGTYATIFTGGAPPTATATRRPSRR